VAGKPSAVDCPSAQPGMADVRILGIAAGSIDAPRLAYLNETVAATPEILAQAAPLNPGEIFRLAARCEATRCTHFDGERCQLATRIVKLLPEVSEKLPPCTIRSTCRWHQQEGAAACYRCPQVVTANSRATETLQEVAGVTARR
jgi:hypothetical protein